MAEKLGEPNDPQSPESMEHFAAERAAEVYFHSVVQMGVELSRQVFSSPAEAYMAAHLFISECDIEAGAIGNLSSIVMRAEGENVLVANTQYTNDGQGTITIHYWDKPEMIPIDPLDSRRFLYAKLRTDIHRREDDGLFVVAPYILGLDKDSSRTVTRNLGGFSVMNNTYRPMLLVRCVEGVQVESVNVRRAREREEAMDALTQYAGRYPDIVEDLERIHRELSSSSHIERYPKKELHSTESLRTLGQAGMLFSSISHQHEDALNTAITATLGEGRRMIIGGTVYALNGDNMLVDHPDVNISGKLLNVITNLPTTSENKGQTLAIVPVEEHDNDKMLYVPLSEIKTLRY